MPLLPVAPPQPVISLGFDFVKVDAVRRRVYAAYPGGGALVIVDADTGKVLGQVRVGATHGVAIDPDTGDVYTGTGGFRSIVEVDPQTMKVVRTAELDGPADAIVYDRDRKRVYAAEDYGTRLFVVDTTSMKEIASVDLPGHKPEVLAVDPATHDIYQNISDLAEFVVIDPNTLKITRIVKTPELTVNHDLEFDSAGDLLISGQNQVLALYDKAGKLLGKTALQPMVDQCDLDAQSHLVACAGPGVITVYRVDPGVAPVLVATVDVPAGGHNVAIDPKTGQVWAVWANRDGDRLRPFKVLP